MRTTNKDEARFKVSDKLKKRALELLDESQAMQFAEGLRLNRAAAVVFAREANRLANKYGTQDPRTVEMVTRFEASQAAKGDLFSRYVDATTPPTTANEGWAVDGFVRTADGRPVGELTVAAYDKDEAPLKGFGSATTDARGFFSIKIDKLPKDPPPEVFMRASRGRKLLESNEVKLVPEKGGTERVEIILLERAETPQQPPDKGPDRPPITSVPGRTPPPVTTAPAPAPDKPPATGGTTTTTATPDKPVPTAQTPQPDKPPATGGTTTTTPDKPPTTGGTTTVPSRPPVILIPTDKPPIVATSKLPVTPKRSTKSKSTTTKKKPASKTSKKKSTATKKRATSKKKK